MLRTLLFLASLLFATAATLLILPLVFSLVQQRAGVGSPSLDPDDPASAFARGTAVGSGETT